MHKGCSIIKTYTCTSLGDVRINMFYCWWYFHLIPFCRWWGYRLDSVLVVVPSFFETHALFYLPQLLKQDVCFNDQRHFPPLYSIKWLMTLNFFSHPCNKYLNVILLEALQFLESPLQISYNILQVRQTARIFSAFFWFWPLSSFFFFFQDLVPHHFQRLYDLHILPLFAEVNTF